MTQENTTTDRLIQVTRNALSSASFRANQYKQVVQKKIDLGAIQKKIEQLHAELGKQVDDQYQAGTKDILKSKETARLLETLFSLRQAAALLEEEIEVIRTETPAKRQAPPTADSTDPVQPKD